MSGCDGAPLLPLLYIITNIAFNISALNLLKYSSAVVSSLAIMSSGTPHPKYVRLLWFENRDMLTSTWSFVVPISIYILSLPLPYLPEGVTLSPFFVIGSVVLMLGLVLYNFSWPIKQESNISWPLSSISEDIVSHAPFPFLLFHIMLWFLIQFW